ncbi:MAG TPA: PP2C family protein-serine/threonine phosphatase, partial [Roseiflexaceae bacterium]|nr:PP2C family protein-serine/threonine phosphatase [Roseiflexaceae bacterium]
KRRVGTYDRWNSPLGGLATTSAALLFGPTALWLGVVVLLTYSSQRWRETPLAILRWNVLRNLALNLSGFAVGSLLGLALYRRLGGSFPLPGLTWPEAPLAALSVLVLLGFDWLSWSCYLLFVRWTRLSREGALDLGLFAKFQFVAYLPEFFAILAAAVYSRVGLAGYLFLIAGALLVSLLAQRLSRAVERSAQRSRELAQIEQLGRAIIAAPADAATLPELLATFVPPMFRANQIEIRLRSGQTLLHTPAQSPEQTQTLWDWVVHEPQPRSFAVGDRPPWSDQPTTYPLATAPIVGIDTADVLGGICVRFSATVDDPAEALPALQSLAAQIASALYRAEEYARTLAHQKVLQELTVAAEIQASLLPDRLPQRTGWQIAAALRPARQTSGDFYDVMELPHGRLGLLIADVTDKGTGAALFMALSRTLIRTFAFEYPDQPEKALHAANRRILSDSRSSMFVTAFYGILDPARATLTYCNAGHNPPFLLHDHSDPLPLRNTGVPLGIVEDTRWTTKTVTLEPGDLLLLYTDGVSEAQNGAGEFFEVERMLAAAHVGPAQTAQAAHASILAAVDRFVGDALQSDDLTLLVVKREPAQYAVSSTQ